MTSGLYQPAEIFQEARRFARSSPTMAPLLGLGRRWLRSLRVRSQALHLRQRQQYRKNLILLHAVLGHTELAGRYWLIGGLLLGWARDGHLIAWDYEDADFAFLSDDLGQFLKSQPRIIEAGFRPLPEWRNNGGEITQYSFERDGAKFEFFQMYPDGDTFRYFIYGHRGGVWQEMICSVPEHKLAEIRFLDRIWLKPDDHEKYLATVYGSWRTPDPGYQTSQDDKNVIAVYPRQLRSSS